MTNKFIAKVEYRCNQCGKVLVGYDKAVMKNEDYLSIKGKLNLQLYDAEADRRFWVTCIPEEKPMLVVCNLECLGEYMAFQKVQYTLNRERHLRFEATQDQETGVMRPTHPFTPSYMKGKYDPKRY